jgi:hypothetical protein
VRHEVLPDSLTDAQNSSGVIVVVASKYGTDSNVRAIPYAERYRDATSLMPTPIERLSELGQPERASGVDQ